MLLSTSPSLYLQTGGADLPPPPSPKPAVASLSLASLWFCPPPKTPWPLPKRRVMRLHLSSVYARARKSLCCARGVWD